MSEGYNAGLPSQLTAEQQPSQPVAGGNARLPQELMGSQELIPEMTQAKLHQEASSYLNRHEAGELGLGREVPMHEGSTAHGRPPYGRGLQYLNSSEMSEKEHKGYNKEQETLKQTGGLTKNDGMKSLDSVTYDSNKNYYKTDNYANDHNKHVSEDVARKEEHDVEAIPTEAEADNEPFPNDSMTIASVARPLDTAEVAQKVGLQGQEQVNHLEAQGVGQLEKESREGEVTGKESATNRHSDNKQYAQKQANQNREPVRDSKSEASLQSHDNSHENQKAVNNDHQKEADDNAEHKNAAQSELVKGNRETANQMPAINGGYNRYQNARQPEQSGIDGRNVNTESALYGSQLGGTATKATRFPDNYGEGHNQREESNSKYAGYDSKEFTNAKGNEAHTSNKGDDINHHEGVLEGKYDHKATDQRVGAVNAGYENTKSFEDQQGSNNNQRGDEHGRYHNEKSTDRKEGEDHSSYSENSRFENQRENEHGDYGKENSYDHQRGAENSSYDNEKSMDHQQGEGSYGNNKDSYGSYGNNNFDHQHDDTHANYDSRKDYNSHKGSSQSNTATDNARFSQQGQGPYAKENGRPAVLGSSSNPSYSEQNWAHRQEGHSSSQNEHVNGNSINPTQYSDQNASNNAATGSGNSKKTGASGGKHSFHRPSESRNKDLSASELTSRESEQHPRVSHDNQSIQQESNGQAQSNIDFNHGVPCRRCDIKPEVTFDLKASELASDPEKIKCCKPMDFTPVVENLGMNMAVSNKIVSPTVVQPMKNLPIPLTKEQINRDGANEINPDQIGKMFAISKDRLVLLNDASVNDKIQKFAGGKIDVSGVQKHNAERPENEGGKIFKATDNMGKKTEQEEKYRQGKETDNGRSNGPLKSKESSQENRKGPQGNERSKEISQGDEKSKESSKGNEKNRQTAQGNEKYKERAQENEKYKESAQGKEKSGHLALTPAELASNEVKPTNITTLVEIINKGMKALRESNFEIGVDDKARSGKQSSRNGSDDEQREKLRNSYRNEYTADARRPNSDAVKATQAQHGGMELQVTGGLASMRRFPGKEPSSSSSNKGVKETNDGYADIQPSSNKGTGPMEALKSGWHTRNCAVHPELCMKEPNTDTDDTNSLSNIHGGNQLSKGSMNGPNSGERMAQGKSECETFYKLPERQKRRLSKQKIERYKKNCLPRGPNKVEPLNVVDIKNDDGTNDIKSGQHIADNKPQNSEGHSSNTAAHTDPYAGLSNKNLKINAEQTDNLKEIAENLRLGNRQQHSEGQLGNTADPYARLSNKNLKINAGTSMANLKEIAENLKLGSSNLKLDSLLTSSQSSKSNQGFHPGYTTMAYSSGAVTPEKKLEEMPEASETFVSRTARPDFSSLTGEQQAKTSDMAYYFNQKNDQREKDLLMRAVPDTANVHLGSAAPNHVYGKFLRILPYSSS